MEKVVGVFEDDWRRIPANVRSIFLFGLFLIVISWLGDRWTDKVQYQAFGDGTNEALFRLGVYIICLFFVVLVAKAIWLWGKIVRMRRHYPVDRLYKDFYLADIQGSIYLFDNHSKQRLHIKTPQTIYDLELWLYGWPVFSKDEKLTNETEIEIPAVNKKVKWGEYQEVPGGLFTRF